jgi:hypothetical protein
MAPSARDRCSPAYPADSYRITPVAPGAGQRLPLTGRYVELVWSELLGPTTTLVARRIGHALDRPDRGFDLSLVGVGESMGVAGKVRWSLTSLAYFELVTMTVDPPAVLTSGLVTPVPQGLLPRLSASGLIEHGELVRRAVAGMPRVGGVGSRGAAGRRQRGNAL